MALNHQKLRGFTAKQLVPLLLFASKPLVDMILLQSLHLHQSS